MHAAANLARKGSQILKEKKAAVMTASTTQDDDIDEPQPQQQQLLAQPATESTLSGGASMQKTMTPEASLKAFELFEALRSFEPGSSDTSYLIKLIDAQQTDSLPSTSSSQPQAGGLPTPLHTAVRCAKPGTVEIVLRHRPQDINARDLEGQTPLHLAAALSRSEVVKLLLSQPNVNDAVQDAQGRTAQQVAKGHESAKIIQISRAQYNESYLSLLTNYVNSSAGNPIPPGSKPSIPAHLSPNVNTGAFDGANTQASGHGDARDLLYRFLSKERASSIEFATLTAGSRGTTIIHEAARRRDIDLLKLCQTRGASMVVRDRKGKMASDATKDESVRAFLKQSATNEGKALRHSSSRASISTIAGVAPLQAPAPPVLKGYLSKWTNMARGYRTRWFVLQHGHLSYYRDAEEEGQASRGAISMAIATVEVATDKSTFTVGTTLGKSSRWFMKANHPVEAMQWVNALNASIDVMKSGQTEPVPPLPPTPHLGGTVSSAGTFPSKRLSANNSTADLAVPSRSSISGSKPASLTPSVSSSLDKPQFPGLNRAVTSGSMMSNFDPMTRTPSPHGTEGSIIGEDDASVNGEGTLSRRPPYDDSFTLLATSAKTQVDLTQQLIVSIAAADNNPSKRRDLVEAANRSLKMLSDMLDSHNEQILEREKWFKRRYEREIEAKRMWEENMRSVVTTQAELEQELAETQKMSSRRKRALKDLKASVLADLAVSDSAAADNAVNRPLDGASDAARPAVAPLQVTATSPSGHIRSAYSATTVQQTVNDVVSDSSDDEDFYDAVESGAVPLRVETPLAAPDQEREWPKDMKMDTPDRLAEIESYSGYKNLRDRLPITSDDRPPVSLWAILKGSIGKDLTKISFPVYFNEPTSMLQRMAEDMEYSECLDAAAEEQDSLKRLAFVTGFAMSNYASTIGRIAKPFNPMLSETFELVNIDKHYRYISEQVSHHPPVSACIAESPNYLYYGEVDAKNKFLGKSFEIRPTGVAHADLIIPQEWGPGYPAARRRAGFVREHYSWKKVTTSVSNFIMGSPQIDHYGDMEVTNHRTGERAVLTFKPRGWRGKDACELKGVVYDSSGNLRWDLAGRWNGQLVARKAGAGHGALNPDDKVPSSNAPEYLLIWKINQQPPNMPFNLTKFALTLNDANPGIKKYLPPTDCRLRPDQHAFEEGRFEQANELKTALEAHQRQTRMQREQGQLPPHKARWFTRAMDPDSQQEYWEPVRLPDESLEYWQERNSNYQTIEQGGEAHWKDVDEIFGIKI